MSPLSHKLPGFDEPLRLMHACHVRMELRCALLVRLCGHICNVGADESARKTADAVLRYFDDAGAKHHQDEEVDLFPALLAAAPPSAQAFVRQTIDRLVVQHREMDAVYAQLRPLLIALIDGQAVQLDPALCDRLHTLYIEHIAIEEHELLPLAGDQLDADAIARLGAAMAARRNVKFEPRGAAEN